MSKRDEFFKKFNFITNNFGKNIFINYVPDLGSSLGITYHEFARVSYDLSEYFARVFEYSSQYIGVSVSDYCFLPCIILAIWKSGNYFAGAGDQYTRKNTLHFLDYLQVRYLISDKEISDYDGKFISSFSIHEQMYFIWKRELPPSEKGKCSAVDDICYGIMTSGSTGDAKIIQVPWSCILPNAIELSEKFEVNELDCIFQASPYSFDPFFIELLMTILAGCSLMIVSNSVKLHASSLLRCLFESSNENLAGSTVFSSPKNHFSIEILPVKKKCVTILEITPSFLKRWTDNEIKNFLSSQTTLRVLLLGGEKFPKDIFRLKHPTNTSKIYNIYGITEVSCWAFLNEVTNLPPESAISLGQPLRNISYKISESGELYIGSKTRICLVGDESNFPTENIVYRNTGDVVKVVNDQLYYVGRSNQVVKKYGMKINLNKIENLFKSKNKCMKECYCIYDEDSLVLGLFFVPFESKHEKMHCNVLTCEDFLSQSLELPTELKDIEKPDYFIQVSQIPLNCHGKSDRNWLLSKLRNFHQAQKPESSLKKIFSTLWTEVLSVKKILPSHGFLELGGNSVSALHIINRLEDAGFYVPQSFINELLKGKSYADCLECLCSATKDCMVPRKRLKTDIKSSNVELSLRWKFDLGKCVDATPSAFLFQGEGRIVIGSHSSQLSCLSLHSGFEIWSRRLGDRIESGFTPTKDGNRGFIGCYDSFVYCLSCQDGSILWKFKTNDMVKSTPRLSTDEKTVYVGSYDKHLYCLSTDDGEVKETLKPGNGSIFCSGVVSSKLDSFYTGTLDGICVGIDQKTNRIKWKTTLGSPIFASPCLLPDGNEILFSEVLGIVHSLYAEDGVKMWTFKCDGNIYSSPVLLNSNIIFGCHDSHVYCLEYESEPKLKWKQQLDSSVFATPAIVSGSSVCIATTKGVIYLCDSSEGSVKSRLELPGEVFSSPVYSSKIFVGCRDNNIYSIDIKS